MILGISTDKLPAQLQFSTKEKLPFPLFADGDRQASRSFGVLRGTMASRATFVIDKEGIVRKIYNPVKDAGGHPKEVLKYVKTTFKK